MSDEANETKEGGEPFAPVLVGAFAEPKPVSRCAVLPVGPTIHVNAYMEVATGLPTQEANGMVSFQRGCAEMGRWVMACDTAYLLAQSIGNNLAPDAAMALADGIAAFARQRIQASGGEIAHAQPAAGVN